jgi:hypothetical protein
MCADGWMDECVGGYELTSLFRHTHTHTPPIHPIYPSIHPIHPSIHSFISPTLSPPSPGSNAYHTNTDAPFHPSIHPSMHSFIHSFIHPSIHASIHPCIHPSIHPSMHPSIHSSTSRTHLPFPALAHLSSEERAEIGGPQAQHLVYLFIDTLMPMTMTVIKAIEGWSRCRVCVCVSWTYVWMYDGCIVTCVVWCCGRCCFVPSCVVL